MRSISRTPLAAKDYREIVDYPLEHSEPAADRFNEDVETTCRLLVNQPRIGRCRDELVPGVRSITVGQYLLFFRATDEEIEILRILHGARNLTP